jgi:predicted MFS family arabinose efflux permease
VTSASIVAGAAIGGVLIDGPGFWALGGFCFSAAVFAALVVWIFCPGRAHRPRDSPSDLNGAVSLPNCYAK